MARDAEALSVRLHDVLNLLIATLVMTLVIAWPPKETSTSRYIMSRQQRRHRLRTQAIPPPWWKRHWKIVATIGTSVAALFGFSSAVVTFLPRMTIEAAGQTDPSNPYPIPITITNTGIIPLEYVQPAVGICSVILSMDDLQQKPPPAMSGKCVRTPGRGEFVLPKWAVRRFSSDERHVVRFDDAISIAKGIGVKLAGADIFVIIKFQPWFMPIQREKAFRFTTRFEKDGKLSWLPRPIEE